MGDTGVSLVTGGTGLLGSHIVEQLVTRERKVRVLVRPASDLSWLQTQPVELVRGDVTDAGSLAEACRGVDTVYHSAARVGDWGPWPEYEAITIRGTQSLIDAAAGASVRRFIHVSSISVYGHVDGEGKVFDETAPLGVKLHRWSYYSRAKVEAERLVWRAHREKRIDATVIRPSWLYGVRDRTSIGRLIGSILSGKAKLIGDGENRLNLVNAANVAQAAIVAAETARASGEAYNCSNDGVITQKEYFNRIAGAIGAPPVTRTIPYAVAKKAAFALEVWGHLIHTRRPPLVTRYSVWLIGRRCFFETRKAREQLNWQPAIPYDTGIPQAVAWYQSQSR